MLDPEVRRVLDGTSIAHLAVIEPERQTAGIG